MVSCILPLGYDQRHASCEGRGSRSTEDLTSVPEVFHALRPDLLLQIQIRL